MQRCGTPPPPIPSPPKPSHLSTPAPRPQPPPPLAGSPAPHAPHAPPRYGLDLFLLSVDEGISGYRDDSLDTVRRNELQYGIPLRVVSYKELYGWTMDEIVAQIGTKNNCTFCGVFRRQALDRGAVLMAATKVATGHNADDVAETVLLNILRGDVPRCVACSTVRGSWPAPVSPPLPFRPVCLLPSLNSFLLDYTRSPAPGRLRLGRCVNIITGEDSPLPRVKPFKYTYEKEIVLYAFHKKLDYFSTECVYAPFAARGFARDFVKDLEVREGGREGGSDAGGGDRWRDGNCRLKAAGGVCLRTCLWAPACMHACVRASCT